MKDTPYRLVLNTCPDEAVAETIAETLVEQGLAACVNILPGIRSVYAWEGKIEHDKEVLLLVKTREQQFQALRQRILALHPYELPEIVAVPITDGLSGYLQWIDNSLRTTL